MNVVIIEDEFVAAQSLQRLIQATDKTMNIETVLQSVEESVEWFSENPLPDLVFMDIHLADGYSFSIFEKVTIDCPIIFTTAYDEYALKAFEVNSIDYLLKPINRKNLEKALNKLRTFSSKNEDTTAIVAQVIDSLNKHKTVYKSHFLIPFKDKLIPLAVDKIAYVYSESKMAKFVTFDNHDHLLDSSLDEVSKQLNPDLFFRANRQFIISRQAIKDFSVWFGGKMSVNLLLPVPEKVIVSRAKMSEFKTWFTTDKVF